MNDKYKIIKRLLLTEKFDRQRESHRKYFFQVDRAATKAEIKRAVEDLFDVNVVKVNTFNRPGKKKRERRMGYGMTAATKRAVVTLDEKSIIDLT